jgi:hypothetical protein
MPAPQKQTTNLTFAAATQTIPFPEEEMALGMDGEKRCQMHWSVIGFGEDSLCLSLYKAPWISVCCAHMTINAAA